MIARDRIIKYLYIEQFTFLKDNVYQRKLTDRSKILVFIFTNCLTIKIISDGEVIRTKDLVFRNSVTEICNKITELVKLLKYFLGGVE